MEYGDKRDYPKIDIYVNGEYKVSTTWSKTCSEAKQRYAEKYNMPEKEVKAIAGKEIREKAYEWAKKRKLTPGEISIAQEYGYRENIK